MLNSPLLSVILCNSDGAADTLNCIESLYSYPPAGHLEIVLVDNASRDGCVALVRARFPEVQVLQSPHRQGFSRNYNLGLRAATGAYLLVLNNDTLVAPETLQRLITALQAHPNYALVGPQLIGADGHMQPSCARALPTFAAYLLQQLLLDPGLPVGRQWQRYQQWRVERRPTGPVPCISGAAMLLSRQSLERIGLLDETYDFYYEDVEWCHRARHCGLEVGYVAEARLIHLGGQSSMRVKVWARQSEYCSALHYFRSELQLSSSQLALLWLATLGGFLIRSVGFLLAEAMLGRRLFARDYLYLWHWLLRLGPPRLEPS